MSICIKYRSDRWENENEKEGKIRISILIFICTIHFAYLKVYTKFYNPKNSDEKSPHVSYRSDRRKIENLKRKQNEDKHLNFH